jgi:hypothetical protein
MTTKKKRKSDEVKARKKKRGVRVFLLSLAAAVGIGFAVFLGITLYDFLYPTAEKGIPASRKEKTQVVLYFSDANERFLVPVKRYIPKEKTTPGQAEELVKALIDGPGEGQKGDLVKTLPEGVTLRGVQIEKDGTAVLDFDQNLVDRHPGGSASEVATVYSLTNTLVQNIPSIRRVRLLVGGKSFETLKGHVDTRSAFDFNKDLIKERSTSD